MSSHILPNAGTMIGVCATLIGLVKITETHNGPSHVDEYASVVGLLFLASAIFSYMSLRQGQTGWWSGWCERIADGSFVVGLAGLATVSLLFAYEFI